MIKGIVFDMDGLMFDTERLSAEGWAFAGKQMGLDITKNIAMKSLGLNIENTKRVFIDELGEAFDFAAAKEMKFDYMTSCIEKNGLPLKAGLIELLDYLTANHYKITVATSTERERAQYYFNKAGISRYFDKIVCGDMIGRGKPEPDIYLKACEIIGVQPGECLALEDSPLGILSAYRAGMKPVMIPDMVQPDEETGKLLYAKLPTLLEVAELLSSQEASYDLHRKKERKNCMNKSKVYYTDFRTKLGEGLTKKLKRLIKEAGIDQIDMDNKFVAIKMHFGELGNLGFLRPNYAKAVADVVKELGGKPFLTDCNTLYPGSRKNALEHLECAWENGFTPLTVGCPVIIADGLKGTDDIAVLVAGGEHIKEAKIGRAIMDADVFISLTHFKGHEVTGFGGTIKNIGMGCGSRAGKKDQHSNGKPSISQEHCRGCKRCQRECANNGLTFSDHEKKMTINLDNCVGCGRCLGACNFDAIEFADSTAAKELNYRMAEYTKAVVDGRPNFHISLVIDVTPNCDCHSENDAPILPNIGMFASADLLALDQACADACLAAVPLPNSQLADNMAKRDFVDHHDHFINSTPDSEWRTCLEHAEKIGLGSRSYELIVVD